MTNSPPTKLHPKKRSFWPVILSGVVLTAILFILFAPVNTYSYQVVEYYPVTVSYTVQEPYQVIETYWETSPGIQTIRDARYSIVSTGSDQFTIQPGCCAWVFLKNVEPSTETTSGRFIVWFNLHLLGYPTAKIVASKWIAPGVTEKLEVQWYGDYLGHFTYEVAPYHITEQGPSVRVQKTRTVTKFKDVLKQRVEQYQRTVTKYGRSSLVGITVR